MRAAVAALAVVAALAGGIRAQKRVLVGVDQFKIANPTSSGSRTLLATIYYPAKALGPKAPLLPKPGGYPVVVFMHGFTLSGWMYVGLGYHIASCGYVAVLADTAPKDLDLQVADARAMLPALDRENVRSGAFLKGAFDTKRAAVMGHSTGGSNVFRVLADNPGYRTGVSLAPYIGRKGDYLDKDAPRVRTPVLTINGAKDRITPWQTHAQKVFGQTTGFTGLKAFYLMDERCNHMTVAAWLNGELPLARKVFERSMAVAFGWLNHWVQDDPRALDAAIGHAARTAPYFKQLFLEVEAPAYFKRGREVVGGSASFELVAAPGPAVHMYAARRTRIQTPLGVWLLDPATLFWPMFGFIGRDQRLVYDHPIPNVRSLRGLVIPFQAVGRGRGGRPLLTRGVDLVVGSD